MILKEKIIEKLKRGLEITLDEAEVLLPQEKFKISEQNEYPIKYIVSKENIFRSQGDNSKIYFLQEHRKILKSAHPKSLKNGFKIQEYFHKKRIPTPKSEGLFKIVKNFGKSLGFSISHVMEYCPYPRLFNSGLNKEELSYAITKIIEYSQKMYSLGYSSFYLGSIRHRTISGIKADNILWNSDKKEPIFLDFDYDGIEGNSEFDSFIP